MNDDEQESWYDDEAGPLVRLYAVTRGRSGNARPELDMLTLVVNASAGVQPRRPEPEYTEILRLSRTPLSVAEVAAQLNLPLTSTYEASIHGMPDFWLDVLEGRATADKP